MTRTPTTTNKALSALRRELFALSETAREVSSLCDTNSIMPSLAGDRLAYQVRVLGVIEDKMLAVADAITAFEHAAGVRVEPTPPEPVPASEARTKRFAAASGRSRDAG